MIKQHIRDHLRTTHTDAELQTWFEPLSLHFADASGLEVRFPHALFAAWFAAERREPFESAARALLGTGASISYTTSSPRPESPKKALRHRSGKPETAPPTPGKSAEPDQCFFDTFLFNSKNEFPVSVAREVAGTPENPAYNPFVICGKGTCGKSHLLKAMARTMGRIMGREKVFLGTVRDLADAAEKNGGLRAALDKFRAVCLDNAQHLAGNPALQRDIVDIADLFRETKKPLVLAMDEHLIQAGLYEKLHSRLQSGLIVTLKKPDLDIRLRYARRQAEALRLRLKKEYILTLVQRFDDLRHLEGILTKLAAFQDKSGRSIGQADLDKMLSHAGVFSGSRPTPEGIITKVAEQFSLPREALLGASRKAEVAQARQIAMYLCRELLGASLAAVGAYFTGKNHATVLYACKKIKELQSNDKDMHNLVTQIRKKCLVTEK